MDPRDHSKLTIIQYEIQQIVMTCKEHVIPETLDIYVRRVQKASCVLNSPRITSVGFFLIIAHMSAYYVNILGLSWS
jgi:hypothetical protein